MPRLRSRVYSHDGTKHPRCAGQVQGHGARIFGGIKRVLGGIEAGYGVFSPFHFSSFFVYWELQDFALFPPFSFSDSVPPAHGYLAAKTNVRSQAAF